MPRNSATYNLLNETQLIEVDAVLNATTPEHRLLWHILFRAYLDVFYYNRQIINAEEQISKDPKSKGSQIRRAYVRKYKIKAQQLKDWFNSDETDKYHKFGFICEHLTDGDGSSLMQGFRKSLETGNEAAARSLHDFTRPRFIKKIKKRLTSG